MKTQTTIALTIALLTPLLYAQNKPPMSDPLEKVQAETPKEVEAKLQTLEGPNKGRIITATDPHLEFFVTADRKILITFLDDKNLPIPLEAPTISAIGGERAAPTRMTFAPNGEGGSFLSDVPLPQGENIPIILQIKTKPDAENVTEKFNVDLSECPTCVHLEYACICGHGEDKHEH